MKPADGGISERKWQWFLDKNRGKLIAILIFAVAWLILDGVVLNRPLSHNGAAEYYQSESQNECLFREVGGPVEDHYFTVHRSDDKTCGEAFDEAYPQPGR
jgi:hypothetical protein